MAKVGTQRNYVAEMRQVIDAATARGTYRARDVATSIVADLEVRDPDLLIGYFRAEAVRLIADAINTRDRSHRAHVRHQTKPRRFQEDAAAHEAGDTGALGHWLSITITCEDNIRKPLANLTREDLLFASKRYEARAEDNRMMATFLKALTKRVKTGVVKDYYTEEQLTSMWESLNRSR